MNESQTDKPETTSPENDEEKKVEEVVPVIVEEKVLKDPEPGIHPVRKNRDERGRKKDDRSVKQVLKALSSFGTSEEKFAAMCKKYADIVDENRQIQAEIKQCKKVAIAIQREKEQLQAEHSKTLLTGSRLQSLCRELQKQNKQIKEESLQRIREEEEKRKAVAAKFQTTLNEITALMQQINENNSKLRDENAEMEKKFKTVCEQYGLREQQVEELTKQMQLESQIAEAKLNTLRTEMVAEKELLEFQKEQLILELVECQHKCKDLQKTEEALNSQISMCNEMYCEFQNALANTNQVYGGFKGEMEKMSKKITKLEKETSVWKMRWESNHKELLEVASEKQQKAAELALASRQLAQLQKLCRTLQADRTSLLMQLKNEGIVPKLSGEGDTSEQAPPENETTTTIEKPTNDVNKPSEAVENGKETDHDEDSSPVEKEEETKSDESKLDEDVPEVIPDNEEKVVIDEKTDENSTPDSNSKTKKGKVNIQVKK